MLVIAAIMLTCALIDWILRKRGVKFQIQLPHRIMALISVVLVTIVYFTVFGLTAVFMKMFGKHVLTRHDKADPSYWEDREKIEPTMEFLRKQG